MGFVYKLTPQISTFIIDQKRHQPRMSCQAISHLIFSTYGREVSKSSVHELLKQSRVIIPKPRKVKEKFQIPPEKKEIFQDPRIMEEIFVENFIGYFCGSQAEIFSKEKEHFDTIISTHIKIMRTIRRIHFDEL